jgi:hypothetical protein
MTGKDVKIAEAHDWQSDGHAAGSTFSHDPQATSSFEQLPKKTG